MELFASKLYHPVFLFLIIALSILEYIVIRNDNGMKVLYKQRSNWWMIILLIVLTIVLGLRPINYLFGDTVNYANTYQRALDMAEVSFSRSGDWLFYFLMYACSRVMGVNAFFLLIEFLYVFPIFFACIRFSRNNNALMMLFCLGAFSFYTYAVNGIRNGMACSLVLLAISFIEGKPWQKLLCAVLCLLAINFHHSTALPVLCMVAAFFIKSPRIMFIFWFASIFVSLIGGDSVTGLFTSLGFDDRLDAYILSQEDENTMALFSRTGFRWDFLLYSVIPIAVGWYIIFKKKVYDKTYLLLLGTYMYSNAFWIMIIRAAYSNRFAYLSWFIYPIVLAYPFLKLPVWKNSQGQKTGIALIGQVIITYLLWVLM